MVIKIQLLKDGHNGKKSFNNFIRATNITDNARKQALLIHSIAQDTEKKIESLNPGEEPTFDEILTTLNNYFEVQKNVSLQRSVFHKAEQKFGSSIEQLLHNYKNLLYIVTVELILMIISEIIKCYPAVPPKLQNQLLTESTLPLNKTL